MLRTVLFVISLGFVWTILVASPALAETGGQFAAPGVRAPSDPHVNGVRFTFLYGNNDRMEGLDLGLLSMSRTRNLAGVGLILGIGKVDGDMETGAHISLINIHEGRDSGLVAAFINKTNNPDNAVSFGFVNLADGTTLVDIGGVNMSSRSTAQLGFINFTDHIQGFQLGFINIAKNGFLPVFPFFNFAVQE